MEIKETISAMKEEKLTPEDKKAAEVIQAELQHRGKLFRDYVLCAYPEEELYDHLEGNNTARKWALDRLEDVQKDLKNYIQRKRTARG